MTPTPQDPQAQRACGAACLSAVYKTLGKEIPANAIWPLIAKQNRLGSLASTTHLMTLHALSQGFSAVAIQARHPIHLLGVCRDKGIAAILNHRLREDVSTGHFSILADIDGTHVVLKDAAFGQMRRITHAEMLRLWQPSTSPSEILGNVLIGIAADTGEAPPCEFCHTPMPAQTGCPKCKRPVTLRPAAVLGCIRQTCLARAWNYVCCPSCDYVWAFNETQTAAEAASPEPASDLPAPPPMADLAQIFAALEQFTSMIRNVPGAAEHIDIKPQLGVIEAAKEKLRLAQAADAAVYQARVEALNAMRAKSAQALEEQRKKMEERSAPPPRLDGDALAQALLMNVGLK